MEPEKPKKGWVLLYIVTGTIDVAQIVIDFLPFVGEWINEVIDPFIGILLGIYFWYKGIMDITAGIAFFMAILMKEGTLGAAPAWVAVTGLVHFNYLRTQVQAKVMGVAGPAGGMVLNQNGVRAPDGPAPLNKDGVRAPTTNQDLAPLPIKNSEPEEPRKIIPMRSPEREDLDMAA